MSDNTERLIVDVDASGVNAGPGHLTTLSTQRRTLAGRPMD